jgi:hypothetical protein
MFTGQKKKRAMGKKCGRKDGRKKKLANNVPVPFQRTALEHINET